MLLQLPFAVVSVRLAIAPAPALSAAKPVSTAEPSSAPASLRLVSGATQGRVRGLRGTGWLL